MNHSQRARVTAIGSLLFGLSLSLPSFAQNDTPRKPAPPAISSEVPYEYRYATVADSRIAYVEAGKGNPVLFIHGNPTSSYLWRNVMPHVESRGRVIALDLIGMGKSDKPDVDYRFSTHASYLEGFIKALDLKNITLVVHDWGSALGMHYARRHPDNVRAIAFMEAIAAPVWPAPSYAALGPAGEMFRNLRTAGPGEEMILKKNFFVDFVLPNMGVMRKLSDVEMASYREPYATEESRRPMLVWPRELPIAGEPHDVHAIIEKNNAWLATSPIPKLFLYSEADGRDGSQIARYQIDHLQNIESQYIGYATHFIQEDNPHRIGRSIADWMRRTVVP